MVFKKITRETVQDGLTWPWGKSSTIWQKFPKHVVS